MVSFDLNSFLWGITFAVAANWLFRKLYLQYLVYKSRKIIEKINETIQQLNQRVGVNPVANITPEVRQKAQKKFDEVIQMSSEQTEIIRNLSYPSRGAAHSRYKNEMGRRLQELEAKKIDIYRELIADGLDVEVDFTQENGQTIRQKLSDAVKNYDRMVAPKTQTAPIKKNRFQVIKNTEE